MLVDVQRPSKLSDSATRSAEKRAVALGKIQGLDLLRARVEIAVGSPALIAMTSATTEDGRGIAAQGLAYALSMAGYSTLFIDTALANRTLAALPRGLGIEEIGRRELPLDPGNGKLAVLTLNDVTLHQTTSLRGMKAAVEILRTKFDYVVIGTEFGMSTAFDVAIAAAADAVLVTIKMGRRKTAADDQLAAALGLVDKRFTGMVEVYPSLIESNEARAVPEAVALGGRRRTALAWMAPFARALSTRLASVAAKAKGSIPAGKELRLPAAPQAPERTTELAASAPSSRG